MSIKLALIGKDISHSQSPEIYGKIIKTKHEYHLLDFKSEDEIPPLKILLETYEGLNITSPYKQHFLKTGEVCYTKLNAINCIRKNPLASENTDFTAIQKILSENHLLTNFKKIIILGDGVMSLVFKKAVMELDLVKENNLYILSRQLNNFREEMAGPALIVNCIPRGIVPSQTWNQKCIFWDLNYKNELVENRMKNLNVKYIDGRELLYTQAIFAQKFWALI